ncbi:MAG: DNA mismatch repair endonuclease MutL [Deltaproteobacteria bacterium]|nr:DNA mismatch repair endonuclease MutL [Deltaproteobacteria bacterium]
MPGKIVLLPPGITNKIAAGEVVERPASILKELLENAIDAGASEVVVHLEKGGQDSIKVVDNGEGMVPSDVPLAFERFATSKIRGFDDIYTIRSFGFRGEAIPSIAAISRVEVLTRRKDAPFGTRAIVVAGEIKEISEAGCPAGTSFLVDHIFDPVPVRRKFLKSATTEQGYCLDVITRIALSHPEIKIRVVNNGREMLNLPATASTAERAFLVLGEDLTSCMVPVRGRRAAVSIGGLVSTPTLAKSTSRHIYVYVNRRYTRDHLLNHAVVTAYRHLLEAKKYPVAVLFIDLPPSEVDVNVHPAKLEVRFQNPRAIYETVLEAIVGVLAGLTPATGPEGTVAASGGGRVDIDRYRSRVEEALKRYASSSDSGRLFPAVNKTDNRVGSYPLDYGGRAPAPQDIKDEPGAPVTFSDLAYAGQVGGTYLVFSAPDAMILLDQHAAHERVLFEKLRKASSLKSGNSVGQRLLLPEVISLSVRDLPFVMDSLPILNLTGMEIEPFGGEAIIVKSLPALLTGVKPAEIINDLLDGFSESDRLLGLKEKEEKILALLACKGAVKASHSLTAEEVKALCHDLDGTPFTSTCPHGRPLYISFSFGDVERMFRRR